MRSLISSIVVICLALEAHALIPAKLLLPHGVSGAHRRSGRSSGIPAFPAPMKMVMDEDQQAGDYTVKQRLRDETESPFRKARQFLVPWLAGSAALGALISGSRLAAIYSGIQGYSLEETSTNLALNLLAVGGLILIFTLDKKAEDANLLRIARSGRLSALKVEVAGESGAKATLPVGAFRRSKRLCIVAGGDDVVRIAQEMATVGREALIAASVVVLPVRLRGVATLIPDDVRYLRESAGLGETPMEVPEDGLPLSPCLSRPVAEGDWVAWVQEERDRAVQQGKDPAGGIVINVEKTGFIKRRAVGVPNWQKLAQISAKLNSQKTGMPVFFEDN